MKIKFDAKLKYQQDAINAVVGVFAGQPLAQSGFEISGTSDGGLKLAHLGVRNNLLLDDETLRANVQKVQEANGIEKSETAEKRDFSIEMETGTGKTYVYLRTIFELVKTYGFKKFIIVVPSVAIREGVLKSIEMTKDHFCSLYNNTALEAFAYDSKKLNKVRQFASGNQIQIMIINIQAFQKDVSDVDTVQMTEEELKRLNVINRTNEKMSGHKPIDFIRTTCPIVIIDEPQSVDSTAKAQAAIGKLNPAAILRYSATHRNLHNLLYKLDPIKALDLGLVKQIEVASITSKEAHNEAYLKLLKTDNQNGLRARVEFHQERGNKVKKVEAWLKMDDSIYKKSGYRQHYDGYVVNAIDSRPGAECVEFSNGVSLSLDDSVGQLDNDIRKAQIYETVEQHLTKQRDLKNMGVKVLSLFFIDRVASYRVYNSDTTVSLGEVGKWFEEAYAKLTRENFKEFASDNIRKIHGGYFSRDKKNQDKDTRGTSGDDENTYNLIMKDKEQLLNPNNPLRFIFSHSALREGWDNPNVFQICTLGRTQSEIKKRQEIGRGLRLPVDEHGNRVHDKNINRLTVIANESYNEFAQALQQELEDECGIKFGYVSKTAFASIERTLAGHTAAIGEEESKKIWQALQQARHIDDDGKILIDNSSVLHMGEEYEDITSLIFDVMKRRMLSNHVRNTHNRVAVRYNKEVYLSDEFKLLWDKIKHRTRYRVEFSTADLIDRAVKRLKILEITRPTLMTETARLNISESGVNPAVTRRKKRDVSSVRVLPDLLSYLQKETELTRHTLLTMLKQSGNLDKFHINPQQFMSLAAREISYALHSLMIDGIKYEKIDNHYWEMSRVEEDAEGEIIRYLDNLHEVQNKGKCLFDHVECDSNVEKGFARDLDNNDKVRLFIKLPTWFKIDTPIGTYNPDWAFVTENGDKLYFVSETKSTLDSEKLRTQEQQKITCGKAHFQTLGVKYQTATKLSDIDI